MNVERLAAVPVFGSTAVNAVTTSPALMSTLRMVRFLSPADLDPTSDGWEAENYCVRVVACSGLDEIQRDGAVGTAWVTAQSCEPQHVVSGRGDAGSPVTSSRWDNAPMVSRTAFVLGGGGILGAHEVGMLEALFEARIAPDLIVGTSIGALNGAVVAADPSLGSVQRLTELWTSIGRSDVFGGSLTTRLKTMLTAKTHLFDNDRLRDLVTEAVPVELIEDLAVPFECVAASVEGASARYFDSGPVVDAVLASSAVPGLLPPVEIDGEHFLDGGLVASIPLDRAVDHGATDIYVLQVGRVEEPLVAPKRPWEVAMIAFEISRRHRFVEALAAVPDGVAVHVLPTGEPKSFNDLRQYRDAAGGQVGERIATSARASAAYLDEHGLRR
jgi:NTE family protein